MKSPHKLPLKTGSAPTHLPGKISTPLIILCLAILFLVGTTTCTDIKRWAYEGFNRDEWQHPEEVIKTLKIQAGYQVADLGAGSGYFTFRLADAVGPTGKVYAVDIDAEMNADLAKRVQDKGYQNIEVVLARPNNPGLPDNGIDLIFTSNTYHHLEDRVTYFANLQQDLQSDGLIAIIDFTGEGWFQQLFGHYTPSETIQRELQEAGYTLKEELAFLPNQVFLIFARNQQ
jgi:ubiquinone/menaquinone biosynthesis C-methylase UbiE